MKSPVLAVTTVLAFANCAQERVAPEPVTLDQAIVWDDTVKLEESDTVLNVRPRFHATPHGDLIVADESENQLRVYASDGSLRLARGRAGDGPGEFRQLTMAVQLPNGDLLGVDWSGRFTRYDSAGAIAVSGTLPASDITDVLVLGPSKILVAGTPRTGSVPERLHIVDLVTGEIQASFFQPPPRRFISPLRAAPNVDRLAVVYGLSDSLYIMDRDGQLASKFKLPSEGIRPYVDPQSWPPPPEWATSFSFVTDVVYLPAGDLLVQYSDLRPNEPPAYHLLMLNSDGSLRFELRNTLQLLAASVNGSRLVFRAPDAETPNGVRIGHFPPD